MGRTELEFEGVRSRSGKSIQIDFRYKGIRCKETIKLKPTATNLKRASRHRASILNAIDRDSFNYAETFPDSPHAHKFETASSAGSCIKIKDYLLKWLEETSPYLAASTINGYKKIINGQLIPYFGELYLNEVKRTHAKEWRKTKPDASDQTIGNIISPLRVALDDAVEDELIDANPLAGWKVKRRRKKDTKKKDKIDPFSLEERNDIFAVLEGQALNLVELAFWTGLRTSELAALEWNDVDWHRKSLFINKALTQAADEPEEPKTAAGEREVPLLPAALKALKRQKQFTFLNGEEVFQNPRTLKRWSGDQPIRKTMWIPALKKAKVRYRYPYQTRHTFVSMMLGAGEDITTISKIIGHTDWAFTARTYSRLIEADAPEFGKKAIEKYSEAQ